MSKTIEEIEKDYIIELGYKKHEDYPLMLTKLHTIDAYLTLHKFMTEVAERYAKYQTQGLIEQNRELVEALETIASLITSQTSISTVKTSLLQILTKYNHLKSNTNGN